MLSRFVAAAILLTWKVSTLQYNTQPFDAVMACVGSLGNCIPGFRFAEEVENAAALFGGAHRREGVVYENFLHAFDVDGHKDCEPQRPGFNTQCTEGNSARWGFCSECSNGRRGL